MSDSLKDKSTGRGGARPGAGRPKGKENDDTKQRREAERQFKNRVAKNVDRLFNSQLDLALGEKYLMVKKTSGTGKNRKTWVEVVTDVDTIKEYLDDDGVSLNQNGDEEYYYMTTKPASNKAIDSLMARAFGTPQQKVDVTSDDEKIGIIGYVLPRPDTLSQNVIDDMSDDA